MVICVGGFDLCEMFGRGVAVGLGRSSWSSTVVSFAVSTVLPSGREVRTNKNFDNFQKIFIFNSLISFH